MPKKIALIGCGFWGQKILKELVNLDSEVDVYEKDPGLEELLLKLGAAKFSTGFPAISENYDGIIVATSSTTHRAVLEKIVGLDIPIFLEKPLTTNLEDALALENIAHENIYLMHIWLYHPGILLLRDIAASGELGNVLGVRSTRANWTSPRKDTDSLWNLSSHDITIAKAILGYIPEPAFAVAERHDGVIRGFVGILGDDPYCVFEVSNRYERKIREVRVHCEKGVVVLEDEKTDYVKIVHGDSASDPKNLKIERRTFDKTAPLQIELREFLDYIDGGPPPKSNFNEGIEVIKAINQLLMLAEKR